MPKTFILILFYSYIIFYYPMDGVPDYLLIPIMIAMMVIVIILLHRYGKNKDYSKYHDKE